MMYNSPWQHLVFDDFYEKELLDKSIIEIFNNLKSDPQEFIAYPSEPGILFSNKNLYQNEMFPETKIMLESVDIESQLKKFDTHRKYDNYTIYGECILCLGDVEYPIHDETPDKIFSSVTYMHPHIGEGTLLYGENKTFSKQVEWKKNRTMMFAGDGVTWHNYKSSSSFRLSLNTFLVKNDLR